MKLLLRLHFALYYWGVSSNCQIILVSEILIYTPSFRKLIDYLIINYNPFLTIKKTFIFFSSPNYPKSILEMVSLTTSFD